MATNANIQININSKGAEKSLNTLQADLEATRQELDRLIKTYGENSSQADNMRKSLVGLETEINKLGGTTDEAVGSTQSLKTELRKLTDELATLEPGSARFKELSIRASELKDQIADTNDVVGQLAGNFTERLTRGITSAVGIGVAGFQALSSAQALFGVESEELQETMVKLQALLNLSQAIETFGGLDQKIVEIKALFGSLTVSTEAQAVAQAETAAATAATTLAMEGEAVAAGGAAASTSVLGVALNALPLVAIVTAIGLLVAGLINYASKSGDAAKEEEKRVKNLEELKKQQEEEKKAVGESSAEYLNLVYRLKETNKNSKERSDLIKEINTTYGTTFKNLQDETSFQDQLNLSIKEYIALQLAKYKQSANEEKLKKLYGELAAAEKEQTKAMNARKKAAEALIGITDQYEGKIRNEADALRVLARTSAGYNADIAKTSSTYRAIEERVSNLTITNRDLEKTIDGLTLSGQKYNKVLDTNTTKIDDNKENIIDYNKYLKDIQLILEENTKVEEENFTKTQELSDKKVDLKDIERRKLEENIRKIYEANKTAITAEVQDENKRTELLKANEDAYTKFQFTEIEKVRLYNEETNKKRLTDQQELNKLLKLEIDALQKEIRFGDGDTSDTRIANSNKVLQAQIKDLETQTKRSLIENRVSLKNEVEFYNQRAELQKQFIQNEDQSNKEAAKAELNRLMDLEVQKYKLNENYLISYNELTQEYEVKSNSLIAQGEVNLIQQKENTLKFLEKLKKKETAFFLTEDEKVKKKNAETTLEDLNKKIEIEKQIADNAILIQDNLNQVKENLNEEYNQKLLTQTSETNERLRDLDIETQNDIFEARIDKLSEYIDYAQQIYDNFNSIVQEAQEQRLDQEEMALDSFVSYEQTKLEQQLENRLITEEEYAARSKQIETKREQDLLKLKRKQFKEDKALNLVQATIDGARATLSAFAGTPGDVIIKSIAAGIAAAFSAVQIGLISKQQFTANKGGIVPGQQIENKDSVSAYLTPGEVVINRQSSQQFLPILDAINRMNGGNSLLPDLPTTNNTNRFQPVYSQTKQQPIRAYVVSSDIENNMNKMDRIRRSTRF